MSERLWEKYNDLHKNNPDPFSASKIDYYKSNSEAIRLHNLYPTPDTAIVIPAFNEESLLARSLAGVNRCLRHHSDSVNVIVVNNGSTDETANIATAFGAIVVNEEHKGIAWARQTGLEATPSSVENVLSSDSDAVIPKNWVWKHKETLGRPSTVFTYGEFIYKADVGISNTAQMGLFAYNVIAEKFHKFKNKRGVLNSGGYNQGLNRSVAMMVGGTT